MSKRMTIKQLTKYADLVTPGTWARLKSHGRPDRVGVKVPPLDLYGLTFGELIQAQEVARTNDIKGLCCLLLTMTDSEYEDAPAGEVMAFAYWAATELEKIGKLFADLNVKPTAEQIQAGIGSLDFGLFGTLDWFCLRMGITNHAEAENIPWIRFYKCMKMDNEKAEYERKLNKIYERKMQQRQQRRRK